MYVYIFRKTFHASVSCATASRDHCEGKRFILHTSIQNEIFDDNITANAFLSLSFLRRIHLITTCQSRGRDREIDASLTSDFIEMSNLRV